jgi:subtilase family serine protease
MKSPIIVAAATALAATTLAAVAGGTAAQADAAHPGGHGAAFTTLSGSVPPFATTNRTIGAVAASQKLTMQVWLKPRTAAAESFATAVSTPGSSLYGHYLSPAAYAARFAATAAQAASVESWLRSSGFTGVAADAGRSYVQATAAVSTIDAAFRVQLRYYKPSGQVNAGKYALRANNQPISLPSSIAASVLSVSGMDNAAPVLTYAKPGNPAAASTLPGDKPVSFPCSQYYGQHYAHNLPRQYGTVNFPTVICGYSAGQLRRAYGYSGRNVGKGVTVALVELGLTPDMFLTLQDYATVNRIQAPDPARYEELSIGRNPACGDPFNIEEQLDVESSYDMAPLATQLVVGGDACNNGFFGLQGLFDADTSILNGVDNHPLASIASNSWEAFDETEPVNILGIEHAFLVRSAAEGVGMYFSSGDGSGVLTPSSDPFATSVGGTTLDIGNKVARLFETGWSTGISQAGRSSWIFDGEQGAAGGGPSLLWAQPAYQRGVVPASLAKAPGTRPGLVRSVPDISAVADPFTGLMVLVLLFNNKGQVTGFLQEDVGGTSLASPTVAGMVAAAQQGHRPFGFINPLLYRLAGTSAFHDPVPVTASTPARYHGVACDQQLCGLLALTTFDDQSFSMLFYTGQVTRVGYDNMTGVGTPNGQSFISLLRKVG